MENGKDRAKGFRAPGSYDLDGVPEAKKPLWPCRNQGAAPEASAWIHTGALFDNVINLTDYRVVRTEPPEEDEWW